MAARFLQAGLSTRRLIQQGYYLFNSITLSPLSLRFTVPSKYYGAHNHKSVVNAPDRTSRTVQSQKAVSS